MSQIPLMILSDAPSSLSGLGRITRELSERIVSDLSDTFRLATLGYGGVGSRNLPWQQYSMCGDPPARGWFVPELYLSWNDFSCGEPGIVMTIWDATRMGWLVDPQACPEPTIRTWLAQRPFELWGYWPMDAAGVDGGMPHGYAKVMTRYDRNLAYSEWARKLMEQDGIPAQALPHGIETEVWYPRDRKRCREKVQSLGMGRLGDNSLLVGVVATNQSRKDWALAFETCQILLKQGKDVLMWCHVDALQRHWDLAALAQDFGMLNRVLVTQPPCEDEDLCDLYSACDATLGIGLGEGFGFPIFESLACGTPCIHGSYGGAAEHLSFAVSPVAWRLENQFNCIRPVFRAEDWARMVIQGEGIGTICPPQLDWKNLWPRWKSWFVQGAEEWRKRQERMSKSSPTSPTPTSSPEESCQDKPTEPVRG